MSRHLSLAIVVALLGGSVLLPLFILPGKSRQGDSSAPCSASTTAEARRGRALDGKDLLQ